MAFIRICVPLFTLIAWMVDPITGFSVGPPPLPTVCKTMYPQHHDYKPQTVESPFTVSVDRNEISGGQSAFVNLASVDPTTKFIGFYLQARDENDNPIGSFSPNEDTKVHNCFGKRSNAAHHATGLVKKDNNTIIWTAPTNFKGEIVFTGTMMRDFVTYWVFLQSEPLIVTPSSSAIGDNTPSPPLRTTSRPRPNLNETLITLFDNIGAIFTSAFRPRNATRFSTSARQCNTDRVFNQWFCNLFSNPNAVGG